MFQVVHALGLLALGAIVVPIVIHLWRRPLPVVRVGSLRPFLAHRRPSRAQFLHEWPLLLLRCAMFVALALALAGLSWTPRKPVPVRWCLRVPGTLLQDSHRHAWNLRLREGFEPRWLAPGFPKILAPAESRPASIHTPVWSWLSEADRVAPAGSEAWVFGPTWRTLFQGNRPTVSHLRVSWHVVPTSPPAVPEPPPTLVGVVHSPDRALDAGYVRAALQAMGVTVASNEVPSWVFQLGAASWPEAWIDPGSRVVQVVRDAPETAVALVENRRIDLETESFVLRQRVAPGPGVPLRRDSHGDPWLTEERQGPRVTWHVAFRFHPDWTDWPLHGAFPAWWRHALQADPPDTTTIAPEQASPRFEPDTTRGIDASTRPPTPVDLRAACWLVAAALFGVERLMSRSLIRNRNVIATASAVS